MPSPRPAVPRSAPAAPTPDPYLGAPAARVLVATDLSPGARRAVDRVASLPLAPDATVEVLHVLTAVDTTKGLKGTRAHARRAVEEEATRIRKRLAASSGGRTGIGVRAATAEGAPYDRILARAKAWSPDLVVVGRHGGGGLRALLIGSTAERVARGRQAPVLVVAGAPRTSYRRVTFALDATTPAERILLAGLRLAPKDLRRVQVVGAYDLPFGGYMQAAGVSDDRLHELRERQATETRRRLTMMVSPVLPRGAPLTITVHGGDARQVIRNDLDRHPPDLLVLGTHARRGLTRFLLGSVAMDVLSTATCDVLVVPPAAAP